MDGWMAGRVDWSGLMNCSNNWLITSYYIPNQSWLFYHVLSDLDPYFCFVGSFSQHSMGCAKRSATGRTTRHRGHGCGAQTHLLIGLLPQGHEKRRGIAFAMQHLGDFKPPIWTYPWRWSFDHFQMCVCVFFPVQERCSKLIDLLPVYSIIVNSPRLIQNLAFSWGGLPGKVAPTCVYLLWISYVR